jgi:cytochrome c oxidase assembly protein subunit 15
MDGLVAGIFARPMDLTPTTDSSSSFSSSQDQPLPSKRPHQKAVRVWLWIGVLMVLVQVGIGGITRLTDSGLSMTTWEPVQGALPPLNEAQWQAAFEDYRQYPEFYRKNADFTLAEFKSIFWWEYVHRNWARLIGLVFAFPFVFFLWRKALSRSQIRALLGVMTLGMAQAMMGWYMVQSGMVDEPWVSPYRLTAHLFLALAIFAFLYRMVLSLSPPAKSPPTSPGLMAVPGGLRRALWVLGVLLLVQIAYGGLVAGSDAARHFNTWPSMNGQLLPNGLFEQGLEWDAVRENRLTPAFIVNVQFVHRSLAFLVLAAAGWLFSRALKDPRNRLQAPALGLLLAIVGQIVLGITTLLMSNPAQIHVHLGVTHQLWAFLLVAFWLRVEWRSRKVQGVLEAPMQTASSSGPARTSTTEPKTEASLA